MVTAVGPTGAEAVVVSWKQKPAALSVVDTPVATGLHRVRRVCVASAPKAAVAVPLLMDHASCTWAAVSADEERTPKETLMVA
jgi:hypothetical protein